MKQLKPLESMIFTIRERKVIIDADLAALYDVPTKALNQAVRRNEDRFPRDFIFRLTVKERLEVVTNCDHLAKLKFSRTLPMAFTEHGAIMAAWDDHQRAVVEFHVVHHDANGGKVVIGVGIERPILMPLDGGAVAGGFEVQLGGVEADIRPPQVLQDGDDFRVAHQSRVGRMVLVRFLDAADPRLGGRMRILQVEDRIMGADRARFLDELVGHAAQLGDFR